MQRRVVFPHRLLPWLLLGPQLAVTLVFFYWPGAQALYMSVLQQDAFGASVQFVGLENFRAVFADESYVQAFWRTLYFSAAVTVLAMVPALLLAVMADRIVRGATAYTTAMLIPYAIAPAVAGVLWLFMFNPSIGVLAWWLKAAGISWNPTLDGSDAMWLVIFASAWKQIAYNFLFFLAGLQSIPKSLLEAAAIDGARPLRRFWTIVFPLLSPTTFFLLVVGLVYAFFDTFGIISAITQGGPAAATETLVYKVYKDGVHNLDLGGSAAQSVVLMVLVVGLTILQFRFVERRVHYG
ncbi:MAG: sn-glycerol-3-phosphate ABC transporter permease UgpA [Burkholderiaceae bacterium]|jgi:sn-glycerol 3-phosphate transport system permease protein|nr:sn-glycerol-3-phosphate ABC transporter permease UgpA [Burkholderiales bacterium]MCZ8104971.1 sn-glycerol-3-phosphate ABC transporter permease UgpA [Burkholderiales bacterium]MCZ8338349.1 sn-glycerol-3-phosphate ABC transporter permease UgpA [Burkholderiaceae bacterium]